MNATIGTKSSTEATAAIGDLYRETITREGFVASDDLVALVARLHRATLTAGLVMRAFHALRQARNQQTNQSATAVTPARS